jgi:THO complex subunit 5
MGGDSEMNAPRVAPLRQLKEACASLRNTLKELEASHAAGKIDKAQLKQQRWQAVVLLSAMKAGLRDTFLAGDEWKTRVQDQKDVVEAHQLQLQNLLYEKDHLVREIRRCKGFHTSEMDRIEFEGGSIPIVVDADVHRKHLDQLTQELETRKRYVVWLSSSRKKERGLIA